MRFPCVLRETAFLLVRDLDFIRIDPTKLAEIEVHIPTFIETLDSE